MLIDARNKELNEKISMEITINNILKFIDENEIIAIDHHFHHFCFYFITL